MTEAEETRGRGRPRKEVPLMAPDQLFRAFDMVNKLRDVRSVKRLLAHSLDTGVLHFKAIIPQGDEGPPAEVTLPLAVAVEAVRHSEQALVGELAALGVEAPAEAEGAA
jgi:hypothetical protein